MTLSISVNPQTETRLRELATAAGKDVTHFVTELVEQAATKQSLDELLAPLRKQFLESGTSEDELVAEITSAQSAYFTERQKKRT